MLTHFRCFTHEIKLSDIVLNLNVIKTDVKIVLFTYFFQIFGDKCDVDQAKSVGSQKN